MTAGVKLSQEEAAARFARVGLEMVGPYRHAHAKVNARCPAHSKQYEILPANIFRGQRLQCCARAAAALPISEVVRRLALRGYELVGGFECTDKRIHVRCLAHDSAHHVLARSVLCDMKSLPCCGDESRRQKMTGRRVTDDFKEKCRVWQSGEKAYWYGKELSASHRENIVSSLIAHYSDSVEAQATHARRGSTAGKPGFFYIFRVGDELKFGSVSKLSPRERLAQVRRATGKNCEILLQARVADAGNYEADMMLAHRQYWLRHEFFRDFRLPSPTETSP